MTFQSLLTLSLGAILVENFVLVRFLGICPFLGVSKKMNTALGMGMAVIFVMTLSSAATWAVEHALLQPLKLDYMRTVVFILVIAAFVQVVEMALKRFVPALYSALGIYLPLITTNCAVLGVAVINSDNATGFLESVLFSFFAAVGFTVAIALFASVRERLEHSDIPAPFEGFPIALVTAALISMAFMGFSGLQVF
ncbi:MAG: electron transport complex subunit RsxA [Oscillospiraceae bacterium]|jgi:electron transport complex protein RnfA|nr:electron transport complex subunit RsxA [Oscillospiraceae bacterium]